MYSLVFQFHSYFIVYVVKFIQRLHTLLRSCGGTLNLRKSKCSVAVQVDIEGARVELPLLRAEDVTWCGLDINIKTLEVILNEFNLV